MSSKASAALSSLPPILPSSLLAPGSEQRNRTLPHCAVLLSTIHARNRNQHRHSSWYRHFSVFRKELIRLCEELAISIPQRAAAKNVSQIISEQPRRPLKIRSKPNKVLAERRLRFWVQARLPFTWHQALTHLIATTQYSSLGLVLVALLARVCTVCGITTALESLGDVETLDELAAYKRHGTVDASALLVFDEFEMQNMLEEFANEDALDLLESQNSGKPPLGGINDKMTSKSDARATSHRTRVADSIINSKRKTKTKSKEAQDAIDVLFSGL